jgi:HD superfamily phosphodiesterase
MKLLNFTAKELTTKLSQYIANDKQYGIVYEYTRRRFEAAQNLVAHNWAHCYRDTLNAIVIGESEGANMRIVLPAITMHDIGFLYGASPEQHGEVGAQMVSEFLRDARSL